MFCGKGKAKKSMKIAARKKNEDVSLMLSTQTLIKAVNLIPILVLLVGKKKERTQMTFVWKGGKTVYY